MAMPHSTPPGALLNRTLQTVLSKRPCRVVIDSDPARPFEGQSEKGAVTRRPSFDQPAPAAVTPPI
jgi:hypothetical protein